MNYAVMEDGVVTNIIVLSPSNAVDFPEAVPCWDIPVAIGDTYDGEHFYRGEERVLTYAEQAWRQLEDMQAALAELGVTVDG